MTTKMLKTMLLLYVIELLGVFIPSFKILPYIFGLSLGLLFAVIKLLLLSNAINKCVDMQPNHAQVYIVSQYLFRYLITGFGLYIAFSHSQNINPFAFVLSLLSLQISAYITKKD